MKHLYNQTRIFCSKLVAFSVHIKNIDVFIGSTMSKFYFIEGKKNYLQKWIVCHTLQWLLSLWFFWFLRIFFYFCDFCNFFDFLIFFYFCDFLNFCEFFNFEFFISMIFYNYSISIVEDLFVQFNNRIAIQANCQWKTNSSNEYLLFVFFFKSWLTHLHQHNYYNYFNWSDFIFNLFLLCIFITIYGSCWYFLLSAIFSHSI